MIIFAFFFSLLFLFAENEMQDFGGSGPWMACRAGLSFLMG